MIIACGDESVLPWPSCDQMNPPLMHEPVRGNPLKNARGQYQRAFYCCDRCDRGLGYES